MHSGRYSIAVLTMLGAGQARGQEQGQDPAEHGRALLQENCARCHAVGKIDGSPLKGAPPFRIIGQSFELDKFARYLTRGIASSFPSLPEFCFGDDAAAAVEAN